MGFNFPTTALDFPFEGEIIEVQTTDTIEVVMKILQENEILSVPVYNNKTKEYIGWFCISDLISIFLSLDNYIKNLKNEELTPENILEITKLFPYRNNIKIGSLTTIEELFKYKISPLFEWKPFYNFSSMLNIIKSLNSEKIKRVPILNKITGKVVKIISQSAISKYVNTKLIEIINSDQNYKLQNIFTKTCEELNLLKKVITVDHLTPVADVLSIMIETKHSCIGITEEFKIFTCVSTNDLLNFESLQNIALNRLAIELKERDFEHGLEESIIKGFEDMRLGRAFEDMNITDFVSFVRRTKSNSKAKAAIIAVKPKHTLQKVIAKMSACSVHRVFITENREVLGVISVRDVVRIMFS